MENIIKTIGVESEDIIQQRQKEEENTLENVYNQLVEYKNNKTILWAEVYSSEIDTKLGIIGVLALWNGMRVNIPDTMYFEKNFKFPKHYYDSDTTPKKKLAIRQRYASYQIGAHVCFTITAIDRQPKENGDGYIYGVVGNRLEAMNILQDIYFKHKKYNVDRPLEIKQNDIAEAHVLFVTDRFALVEALGVETRIDAFNLSNEFVSDCRDIVKPGDALKVRIKKLHVNGDGEQVYLTVSARINATSEEINNMKTGSTYLGIVVKYNKDSKVYTVRLKNGVNASVIEKNIVNSQRLISGDQVVVLVNKIEQNYVMGTVMKIF